MIGLIAILIIILLAVIVVQIGRVSELAANIRGEEEVAEQRNNRQAFYMMVFLVAFLVFCIASAWFYKDSMLGYGPHESASAHGGDLDYLFDVTLFFTGIVFVLTHIALFWFSYKYRDDSANRIAYFFPHSTKLEVIWTVIPSFVLIFLVVKGLNIWNNVMADVNADEEHMEIEATGYQFAWDLRYPGADGKLGTRDYKLIDLGSNPLGQKWTDPKNIDDFLPDKLVLPVGKKVRVRITSKDVLHNFYLPHFRVKMDAVPGLPTYFVFTPTKTTAQYRQSLKEYPEWQKLDVEADDGTKRWENFKYELACAELCGKGHYSMRREVVIVEQEEYEAWLAEQNSYYMSNIRNTDEDPFKGQLLDLEIIQREGQLKEEFSSALSAEESTIIRLKNVFFDSGTATLQDKSKYELNNVAELLKANSNVVVELGGHTDSQGEDASNMSLSERRADSALNFLLSKGIPASAMTSKGYGENNPVETNDTPEGREANRRTELKIISK